VLAAGAVVSAEQAFMNRARAAAFAGSAAIVVNTLLLMLGAKPLHAPRGGLLKLVDQVLGLSAFTGVGAFLLVHLVVGVGAVAFYWLIAEPLLPGPGIVKGSLLALAMWLGQSLVVSPLLGEGPLGIYRATPLGVLYFAFATWAFGAVLGVLFQRLTAGRRALARAQ